MQYNNAYDYLIGKLTEQEKAEEAKAESSAAA